jgi:pimeloyl-ACP methyl ester carboxylesterase
MASHAPIVGRYLYLDVDGQRFRVYYEEAGSGIPLVAQHTAGGEGRQWRHLLEDPEVTAHFRVIVPDLPMHGKSLPGEGSRWWEEEYKLSTEFFMNFHLAFAQALELDRPVYIGCSMGGHLAPDLALNHPEAFRAVIGVEAALASPGDPSLVKYFWHPRVSADYVAAIMVGLCGPFGSDEARHEVGWVYSDAAQGVYAGDVNYYTFEHDVTETAKNIDTSLVDVYLLNGEYDWSASPVEGQALADQIPGAHFTAMAGLGHFPMIEDYPAFKRFLGPVLDEIRAKAGAASPP